MKFWKVSIIRTLDTSTYLYSLSQVKVKIESLSLGKQPFIGFLAFNTISILIPAAL
jgi:hypothetical protein